MAEQIKMWFGFWTQMTECSSDNVALCQITL